MFKFLIVLVLIIYIFYKVAGILFRIVFSGLKSDPWHFQTKRQQYSKKASNSNLNIDNIPRKQSKKNKNYDGGEYVDFEELK
ncbi:MAG: hypothetical protein AAF600_13315 [Bacteroidota bacterium]